MPAVVTMSVASRGLPVAQTATEWSPIGVYTPDDELLFPPGEADTVGNAILVDDRGGDTNKLWIFFDVANSASVRYSADGVDGPWTVGNGIGVYRTLSFHPVKVGGKWHAVGTRNSSTKVCYVTFDTLNGSATEVADIADANTDGNGPFVVGTAIAYEAGTWIALWATAPSTPPYSALMRRSTSANGTTWSAGVDTTLIGAFSSVDPDVKWLRWMVYQILPSGRYGLWFGAGTFEPPGADIDLDAKVYYGEATTLNGSLVPSAKVLDPFDYGPPSPIVNNCYAPFGFLDPVTDRQLLFINTGVYGDEGVLRLELL